ncbi:unnamed protein product [Schistosoma margrebowiei]|uniref:Uncharacterized protein n=1 Tax=Schistosoma margrebowiei TaxID=48269 RepID=A0A183MEB1_9TREM|nr:unnamed protein product [Schistosoma margrebowiei]
MESSRPKEKRRTKEQITPRNGNRHEENEQELDGIRNGGPGQSGLESVGRRPMLHWERNSEYYQRKDRIHTIEEHMQIKTIVKQQQSENLQHSPTVRSWSLGNYCNHHYHHHYQNSTCICKQLSTQDFQYLLIGYHHQQPIVRVNKSISS